MTTLVYKIPPRLSFPKGGITPLWQRGARGDFGEPCQFNSETLYILNLPKTWLHHSGLRRKSKEISREFSNRFCFFKFFRQLCVTLQSRYHCLTKRSGPWYVTLRLLKRLLARIRPCGLKGWQPPALFTRSRIGPNRNRLQQLRFSCRHEWWIRKKSSHRWTPDQVQGRHRCPENF